MRSNQSVPDLEDIRSRCQSFEYFGGSVMQPQDYTGDIEPLQVQASLINADLFKALGAKAAIGRTISDEDDRFGADPVVVLSHGFWQRTFGGDGAIIGKPIQLSGKAYVVGVMPADFNIPRKRQTCGLRCAWSIHRGAVSRRTLRTYIRLLVSFSRATARWTGSTSGWRSNTPRTTRRRTVLPHCTTECRNTRSALLFCSERSD
jgi:hypothetical protein